VYWQVLASRLGVVTGLGASTAAPHARKLRPPADLATHCRLLLHSRTQRPRLCRWLLLYPLYAISEAAIVATDLAEVLGSGIALSLLFPALPLWGGVLLTSADVFVLLLVGDPLRGRPVRMFEYVVGGVVLAVLVCMGVIVGRVHPHWADVFQGFLPSKYVVQSDGLYVCECAAA
jgi:metal iron transporter